MARYNNVQLKNHIPINNGIVVMAVIRLFNVCRRAHHIGSTVRSNPPFVGQVESFFFFFFFFAFVASKFPRHGNNQCDSQNKPRQGSTWRGYEPRKDTSGQSLPETEKLAFLSSSTRTGLSSMRRVSLFPKRSLNDC